MPYVVSSEKQELFNKLLGLLIEFNRVCTKYNIKYFVFAGTMLGAIRHKGFIPWDDDVDIIMPRADYDRLKTIVTKKKCFKEPYFFQNPVTDQGYPKGFCRLRNSNTTEIPYDDVAMNCNRGIFIDIFPLDILPNNKIKQKIMIKRLHTIRLIMNSYARYYSGFGTVGTTKMKALAYYCSLPLFKCGFITMKSLYSKYEKIASKYKNTDGKLAGTIVFSYDNPRFIFNRKWWESDTIWVNFESIKVPIPKEYDNLLKHSYGDYMTPVQEPTNHGDLLFSTTIPYEVFIKKNFNHLKRGWYRQTEIGKKTK